MVLNQEYIEMFQKACEIFRCGKVSSFPLNPVRLASAFQIRVMDYEQFSLLSGNTLRELHEVSLDGFSICKDGVYAIVYNQCVKSKGRRRWTLTHELSHIFLGHIGRDQETIAHIRKQKASDLEKSADILTACLISPLPIAHLCNAENFVDMQRIFGISKQAAQLLFADLEYLLGNNYISCLDFQGLAAQCIPFISYRLYLKHYQKRNRDTFQYHNGIPDVSVTISNHDYDTLDKSAHTSSKNNCCMV